MTLNYMLYWVSDRVWSHAKLSSPVLLNADFHSKTSPCIFFFIDLGISPLQTVMVPPTNQSVLQVPCNQQPLPQQLEATAKQPCIPLPVYQQTQSYRPEPASPIVHHLSAQQQPVAPQGTLQTSLLAIA